MLPLGHLNLGLVLLDEGDYDGAIEAFSEVLALEPHKAAAYEGMAVAHMRTHQYALAAEEYRQALQIEPDSGRTHANLASALAELGRIEEARHQAHEAERLGFEIPPELEESLKGRPNVAGAQR
jgi:Tfp pilus assembly protein PilF